MATVTVKNIPDDLYARLKESAVLNRRSINSEIIVCIEQRVRRRPVEVEAVLKQARALRRRTSRTPIDARVFQMAKRAGRP